MRVQHNIASMNAYRNYNNNAKSINKNLEKLSSGYKINRAGDDAAGLAISEKMRAQITGLETAQKNAKDGISLVQTAEGALTEVHTMLNRMYQLAEQSANGTYDEDLDREQLNKEVTKLRDEIDRISETANFNGIKLFKGSTSIETTGQTAGLAPAKYTVSGWTSQDTNLNGATVTMTYDDSGSGSLTFATDATNESGTAYTVSASGITAANMGSAQSGTVTITDGTNSSTFTLATDGAETGSGVLTLKLSVSGEAVTASSYTAPTASTAMGNTANTLSSDLTAGKISLWVGDFTDSNNRIELDSMQVNSQVLSITSSTVNISTQEGALDALDYIKDAINYVSDIRGSLGATQNRLDHTINNLSVMQENIQDAESTIRDTDVADEMMKYTKNSILVQSAQAMLAQANQQPQGVLQLLQ